MGSRKSAWSESGRRWGGAGWDASWMSVTMTFRFEVGLDWICSRVKVF